jgi:hemerythrin-like domain-containing protein
MQRSPQLAVLSREHHVALEIALRLKRATDDDSQALSAATLKFWNTEGRQHFALEEEVVLPALAARTSADDPDIKRILAEHADLSQRMTALADHTDPNTSELHELGSRLRDHVRYEERHLFERIESTLTTDELATLGNELQSAGSSHQPPRA